MASVEEQKEDEFMEMELEVPEIDLLVELLDASVAAEEAGGPLAGFGGVGDDSQELNHNHSIHPHHDCEDCGLDGILSDLVGYGSPRPGSPAPYLVFGDDAAAALEWTGAAMWPFAGEGVGEWYMDGMVMAMEWDEEEEDGGGGFPFEPGFGVEAGAGAEQEYGSPLWK